jgi:hypothetical protein
MISRVRWLLVVTCACGRIGFDPIGDGRGGGGGGGDGGGPHDARVADAPPTACTFALPIDLGVRKATSTCVGHDLVAGCGPPQTEEVVFSFTAPATNGYSFRAFDPGTNNVSNSTAQLDTSCTTKGSCAGILGITVNAGETVYLVVEASAGGCTNIEFEAM